MMIQPVTGTKNENNLPDKNSTTKKGCPQELDPHKNCVCCGACFINNEDLKNHVKEKHPKLFSHWKKIVKSWEKTC